VRAATRSIRSLYRKASASPRFAMGLNPSCGLTTRPAQVICPSGGLLTGESSLISDFPKNVSVPTPPNQIYNSGHPTPQEGRIMIVTDAGWNAVDAAALAREGIAGRVERPVSDHQASRRTALTRTAKLCGPDAPTLASSSRSRVGPTGLRQNISVDDGGKRARSPGRARRKPLKPLRAGMPGDSGVLVVTRVRSTTPSAHEAAGAAGTRRSPRPLFWAKIKCISSGASRREREGVSANNAAVEVGFRTKQSLPSFLQTRSSCPDFDPGIHPSSQQLSSKRMDHRVKPGDQLVRRLCNELFLAV
jgi:hypothetical protein